jgi:hypothetical protein
MDNLRAERDEFLYNILKIEEDVEEEVQKRDREPWSLRLQAKDHRAIFHGLSKMEKDLRRIEMLIDRIILIMKFAAEMEKTWQGPQISANLHERMQLTQSSLEYMSVEIKGMPGLLKSQVMIVTNLVAQQDIVLSSQIAEGSKAIAERSKAIAAATRRDGIVMKIIAGVGAVFLPATVISVRSVNRGLSNTVLTGLGFSRSASIAMECRENDNGVLCNYDPFYSSCARSCVRLLALVR